MQTFDEYRGLLKENSDGLDKINALISDKIDNLVYQLKRQLISMSNDTGKVSTWDRIKNWGSNLLYGSKSPMNPYRNRNSWGNLGLNNQTSQASQAQQAFQSPQASVPENYIPLELYHVLKEAHLKLDEKVKLNEGVFDARPQFSSVRKNTVLYSIIDQWANDLKKNVMDVVAKNIHLSASGQEAKPMTPEEEALHMAPGRLPAKPEPTQSFDQDQALGPGVTLKPHEPSSQDKAPETLASVRKQQDDPNEPCPNGGKHLWQVIKSDGFDKSLVCNKCNKDYEYKHGSSIVPDLSNPSPKSKKVLTPEQQLNRTNKNKAKEIDKYLMSSNDLTGEEKQKFMKTLDQIKNEKDLKIRYENLEELLKKITASKQHKMFPSEEPEHKPSTSSSEPEAIDWDSLLDPKEEFYRHLGKPLNEDYQADLNKEMDEKKHLSDNGHGRWVGSCGHVIMSCRCMKSHEEIRLDMPCKNCADNT